MKKIVCALFVVFMCICGPVRADARAVVPGSGSEIKLSFAPLVKKIAPAVVNIYTKRTVRARVAHPFMNDPFFNRFFQDFGAGRGGGGFGGLTRERVQQTLGSGIIIDRDGIVVTNAHVIDGAQEITVMLADGREFAAELVVSDPPSDLALLRMDTGSLKDEDLPFAPLKPSETLEVGDLVLAIGNPFGVGQTVTSGIVSALARSSLNINDFNFFIQTDAAINPGNSGGALVDMSGGVVGINTAIYSRDGGSLGIGFSIPSEMVAALLAAEKSGRIGARGVTRAWLGATAQKITSEIAETLGLSRPQGALVAGVSPSGPAAKAGLKTGDVVTMVEGKIVRDPAEMHYRWAMIPVGETAEFTILRKGKERTLKIAAILPPDQPDRETTALDGRHPLSGATVVNLNPAVRVEMDMDPADETPGVAVTHVARGTPAGRIVAPGDVIRTVGEEAVHNVKDLKKALENMPRNNVWSFSIERDGALRNVIVR